MSQPDVPDVGLGQWAAVSGMHPDDPLVGGRGGMVGGTRRVARAAPDQTALPGAENIQGHYSQLLNFKGSPMPWLLLAAIAYLGLVHLHVAGGASVGLGRK